LVNINSIVTSSDHQIYYKRAMWRKSQEPVGAFREVPNVSRSQCQETKCSTESQCPFRLFFNNTQII